MSQLSTFYPAPITAADLGLGAGSNATFSNLVLTDNDGLQTATFNAQSKLTESRTYDLPDKSGVIGLTSDFAAPPSIGSTTPNSGAFTSLSAAPTSGSALTLTGGTVTASAPLIDASQTWNDSGTTFTGMRFVITNTASDHRSLLFSLDDGATPSFGVQSIIGVPIVQATRLFGGSRGLRFGARQTGATGATDFCAMRWQTNTFSILHGVEFGWSSLPYDAALDLALHRDAANTLAQRNGTNAQTFRLYNTFTSTTNFERLNIIAQLNGSVIIGTEKGSAGGTARALELQTDGVTRMVISATGDVGIASTSAPTGGFGSAVIGQLNTASGNASYVLGRDSTASSTWAVALAYRSLADRNAMLAFAGGRFAARGDAQNARFVLRCTTTTNAAVEMFLGDTTTTYLTIPSGKVIFCNIKVVGVKSDGSVVATYERQYAAKNVAGTSSEVFAPVTIGTDNASSTSLEIATVDAGDYIRIRPTGIASETWRWVATVDAVEVAYGA
jgi:hypothetical protein